MIEIDNGKWFVRLKPETREEIEFLKSINKPVAIGYLMSSGEFLVKTELVHKIMESCHAIQSTTSNNQDNRLCRTG